MSQAILSMVLDLEVERHKRELAEGFAALRKRLLPPEPEKTQMQYLQQQWLAGMQNMNMLNMTQLLGGAGATNVYRTNAYPMQQHNLGWGPFDGLIGATSAELAGWR